MIFSETLNKNNILFNPKSKTKWQLISEMLDIFVKNGLLNHIDAEPVKSALFEREKTMSTGIGKGIAIPHCATDRITNIVIALAICKNGIEFDSIDGLPVHITIMIIVPQKKISQHVKTLANIAKIMNDENLREKLIKTKSADTVIDLIKNAEEKVKK
jgi:PTS system fructose-specific IIC component